MAETDQIIKDINFDFVILIEIILVLFMAYLAVRVLTYLLMALSERAGKYRITVKMLLPLFKFSIYGFAIYIILSGILTLSSSHLIAFSGLLGAAIGFGLKDLFADVIGGIIIILENPYKVGDKVKMGDYYGEVVDIGIRATRLVTPDDNLISVPNFLIFTSNVASANAGNPEMMVVVDLYIDYESDIEAAMKILKETIITSKFVYISRKCSYNVQVENFPYYRRLRAKAYVYDLRSEFDFKSEISQMAWKEFERIGIKSPKLVMKPEGGPTDSK